MVVENMILGTDLSKRKYGLDILRALAIIFVLIHHTDFTFLGSFNKVVEFFTIDGVSIFFVLSGYLIGSILLRTINNKDFTCKELFRFWINRWMRTLPPYYLVLIVLFFISKTFTVEVQSYFLTLKDKISYFLFLQNFKSPHFGFFAESWSLSVEEWFYLLVPISLFILYRLVSVKKSFLIAIVGVILFVTIYRIYSYLIDFSGEVTPEQYDLWFRKLVITRLDNIVFGVLGAYVAFYFRKFWENSSKRLFVLGIVLILIDNLISSLHYFDILSYKGAAGLYSCGFSFSVMSLGVLLLLPYLDKIKKREGFIYKSITLISLVSYSLYLLHFSLIYFCIMVEVPILANLPKPLFVIVYWTICMIASCLMYRFIEKPFMDSRKTILKKLKL